jgi:hypothetical protein
MGLELLASLFVNIEDHELAPPRAVKPALDYNPQFHNSFLYQQQPDFVALENCVA